MNTEALLAQLRADLQADDEEHAADPNLQLGRMITTAVRSGRRRRATTRLLATTATIAMIGAVSTLVWPVPTLGGRLAEPAAPPTASASPYAPAGPTADDPQPLPATGQDVINTLSGLLPPTFTVSHASDYVFPQNYEMHVGLTVTDDTGSAWVGAGISAGPGLRAGCGDDVNRGCSTRVVDGVTLSVEEHVTNSKACDFTRYEYVRPSGDSVWFGQVNTTGHLSAGHDFSVDCDRRSTRPRMPLTEQQIKDLLTDPAWDPLFAR